MNTCPTVHPRADIDPGFFASPVPLPWTRTLANCLGRFNDPKRAGYNPAYQWGDDDAKVGHKGLDLGVPFGGPVTAMADGVVASIDLVDAFKEGVATADAAGVWVSVLTKCPECPGWFLTRYLHLLTGSVLVKPGQPVKRGEKLGRGDTTGNASWSHCHMDLRHSDSATANLVPSGSAASWFGPKWGKPYDALTWGIQNTPPPVIGPPAYTLVTVTVDRPVLRLGSAGKPVEELQLLLNVVGASLNPDGKFGPLTDAAVKSFQASKGLNVDGVVGTDSWRALLDY